MKLRELSENTFLREKEYPLLKFVPALVLSVSLAVTHQLCRYEKNNVEVNSLKEFTLRRDEVRKKLVEQLKEYGHTLY